MSLGGISGRKSYETCAWRKLSYKRSDWRRLFLGAMCLEEVLCWMKCFKDIVLRSCMVGGGALKGEVVGGDYS